MKNIVLETVMSEAGSIEVSFKKALMGNADFVRKFNQLIHAKLDLGMMQNSHIMNRSDKTHHDNTYAVGRKKSEDLHREIVVIAKSVLANMEVRSFDLDATEEFSHLSVKEVFAKLENGEISSVSAEI